jgi:hypothetical protein
MNSKQFLQVGGVILLLLGIVGFFMPNILGELLTFNAAENYAHLVLGVVALLASTGPVTIQKPLVLVVGLVALFFGVAGFMVAGNAVPNFFGVVHLDNPVDNVLHLVVGVWAIWAGMNTKA